MQIRTALALSAAMLLSGGAAAQQTPSTNTQTGSQTNQSGQTNSGQSGNTTGNTTDQTTQGQTPSTPTTQSGTSTSGQSGQSAQPDQSTGQSGSTPSGQSTSGSTSGQSGSQTGSQSSGASATGSSAAGGALSAQDREFVHQAAMGGMGEVEMGKLALQKASSDAVKQYAQKMIDDHTKANDELKSIASAKGITLPDSSSMMSAGGQGASSSGAGQSSSSSSSTTTSSGSAAGGQGATMSSAGMMGSKDTAKMHEKHMAAMTKLQGLSGAEFDREYINQAGNKDHEQQAKLFERQASRGTDAELKAFAAKTLPTVQGHLSAARDLSKTLKGGSTNPSGASGSTTNQ